MAAMRTECTISASFVTATMEFITALIGSRVFAHSSSPELAVSGFDLRGKSLDLLSGNVTSEVSNSHITLLSSNTLAIASVFGSNTATSPSIVPGNHTVVLSDTTVESGGGGLTVVGPPPHLQVLGKLHTSVCNLFVQVNNSGGKNWGGISCLLSYCTGTLKWSVKNYLVTSFAQLKVSNSIPVDLSTFLGNDVTIVAAGGEHLVSRSACLVAIPPASIRSDRQLAGSRSGGWVG